MALQKQQIIDAALEILDDYGLSDLTMRRLAENLDVKASALYWHIANKQTLLAEVVQAILAEPIADENSDFTPAFLPLNTNLSTNHNQAPRNQAWHNSVLAWALTLRNQLLAHRDSADLVASMRAIGLAATDLTHAPEKALTSAGLSPASAKLAMQTLLFFVLGHTNEEQQRAQLSELSSGTPFSSASNSDASFLAGINLIISGINIQF